jgi:hypothetical protein
MKKGNVIDLWLYFHRPKIPEFQDLLFADFFKKYRKIVVSKNLSESSWPRNCKCVLSDFHLFPNKRILLKERDPSRDCIVRVALVSHTVPELFYLRRILMKEPVFSFEHALGGYETFQESAIAKGYVNTQAAFNIFDEMLGFSTPKSCRNMFVTLTIEGYPTLPLIKSRSGRYGNVVEEGYYRKYYEAMTSDYQQKSERRLSDGDIFEKFLTTLDFIFKCRGKYFVYF